VTISSKFVLSLVATGVATVTLSVPAAQAEGPQHCWLDVETGENGCFGSFADLIGELSGGTVQVSKGTSVLTDAQRAQLAIGPTATYVIGQLFENLNYGGDDKLITASGDCDTNSDVDYYLGSMPSGWNDRVSSFKSYGLCATRIWENTNFGGASYGFVVNSTYVGDAMNDRASSIQWN
jgi:hypothetical protein